MLWKICYRKMLIESMEMEEDSTSTIYVDSEKQVGFQMKEMRGKENAGWMRVLK